MARVLSATKFPLHICFETFLIKRGIDYLPTKHSFKTKKWNVVVVVVVVVVDVDVDVDVGFLFFIRRSWRQQKSADQPTIKERKKERKKFLISIETKIQFQVSHL